MRQAAAEFIIGDDLLRAGMNDIELNVPDRAICRHLEFEHRISLTGILPVLMHEHAAAVGGPAVVPEDQAAPYEAVYFHIQPIGYRLSCHMILPLN